MPRGLAPGMNGQTYSTAEPYPLLEKNPRSHPKGMVANAPSLGVGFFTNAKTDELGQEALMSVSELVACVTK